MDVSCGQGKSIRRMERYPPGACRVCMGLEYGETGLPEESGGEQAEWFLPDKVEDCRPYAALCSFKEALPL